MAKRRAPALLPKQGGKQKVKVQHMKGDPPPPVFYRITQIRQVDGPPEKFVVEGRTHMEAEAKLPRFGKLLRQDNTTFTVGGGK